MAACGPGDERAELEGGPAEARPREDSPAAEPCKNDRIGVGERVRLPLGVLTAAGGVGADRLGDLLEADGGPDLEDSAAAGWPWEALLESALSRNDRIGVAERVGLLPPELALGCGVGVLRLGDLDDDTGLGDLEDGLAAA